MLFTFIDKQIAWFQISVHDSPLVAMENGEEHLPDNVLDVRHREWLALLVQVLLHVEVEVLEDEVDLVLAMDDVQEIHYAWMVQFLEQRHLPDRRTRYALIRVLYLYLFQGNNL